MSTVLGTLTTHPNFRLLFTPIPKYQLLESLVRANGRRSMISPFLELRAYEVEGVGINTFNLVRASNI
jgi:hypothetical protein